MNFFANELERFGQQQALVTESGDILTYQQLAEKVAIQADKLGNKRKLIALEVNNTLAPLITYLAALKNQHPVILLGPGEISPHHQIIKKFNPQLIYKLSDAGDKLQQTEAYHDEFTLHEELSVLLSTSGSTGSAKLVRLSRSNIQSNADAIAKYLSISNTQKAITTLPFHYSYGFSVINSYLSVGATILLTELSVSQPDFWSFFKQHQATSLAAVPYTFELLERMSFRELDLPSLKYMTQAGGKLPEKLVKAYGQWANENNKKFYVMYGQTEASPRMAYLPPDDLLNNINCIGRAIPGGHLSIYDDSNNKIVEKNTIGELRYTGSNVMMGYAQTRTDLALAQGANTLKTGDLASINEHGFFKIEGRISRFAKIYGLRLSFDEIEHYFSTQNIHVIATGNDEQLVIATNSTNNKTIIEQTLVNKYKLNNNVFAVIEVEKYPLFSSGKYDYNQIKSLAKQKKQAPYNSISEAYRKILDVKDIRDTDSFLSLGGDSLFYVMISIAIEEQLSFLPDNWEALPIKQLDMLRENKKNHLEDCRFNPILFLCILTAILVSGELFLQVRSHIKEGRSAFNLLTDSSTTVFNESLSLKTYRPNYQVKAPKNGQILMSFNSLGLRSDEISKTPLPNEIRIAVLGASTVAGIYAKSNEQTFPALLQKKLRVNQSQPINVINAGIEGYDLKQITTLNDKLIAPLSPDIAIIYPGFNDMYTICKAQKKQHTYQSLPYLTLPNWVMSKSIIRKNSIDVRSPLIEAKGLRLDPSSIDTSTFRNNLDALIQNLILHKIKPVLSTVARSYMNVPTENQKKLAEMVLFYYPCLDIAGVLEVTQKYNQQIRNIAQQYNLPLIDISQHMPGGNENFVDASHFTFAGESYMAEAFSAALEQHMQELTHGY